MKYLHETSSQRRQNVTKHTHSLALTRSTMQTEVKFWKPVQKNTRKRGEYNEPQHVLWTADRETVAETTGKMQCNSILQRFDYGLCSNLSMETPHTPLANPMIREVSYNKFKDERETFLHGY